MTGDRCPQGPGADKTRLVSQGNHSPIQRFQSPELTWRSDRSPLPTGANLWQAPPSPTAVERLMLPKLPVLFPFFPFLIPKSACLRRRVQRVGIEAVRRNGCLGVLDFPSSPGSREIPSVLGRRPSSTTATSCVTLSQCLLLDSSAVLPPQFLICKVTVPIIKLKICTSNLSVVLTRLRESGS